MKKKSSFERRGLRWRILSFPFSLSFLKEPPPSCLFFFFPTASAVSQDAGVFLPVPLYRWGLDSGEQEGKGLFRNVTYHRFFPFANFPVMLTFLSSVSVFSRFLSWQPEERIPESLFSPITSANASPFSSLPRKG